MRAFSLLACAALLATLPPQSPAFGQTTIEGVSFVDRGASGEINLGPVGAGPCVLDYDNDGWTDVILRDGIGQLVRLYHNVPDPGRSWERTFVDVTAQTVFAQFTGTAATPQAALAADFDNDGWTDVYLMGRRAGEQVSGRLYRNNAAGDFIDVTLQSGVQASGDDPESASWVDYDLDGWVDLMVVSRGTGIHPWRLLRNVGGTFEDVTASVLPNSSNWSRMYGHTWTDVDADGYPDCFMIPTSGPVLLHNIPGPGPGGRRLVNEAFQRGFAVLGPAPMGISAGDYDNDGDFDIGLTNGAIGVYYENLGGTMAQRQLMESIWAWGVLWLDVNNDGLLDHYQAGSVGYGPNHNKLFLNRGGGGAGGFEDISPALNDLFILSQYALQFDFNNDGRQDILTQNPYNTPVFSSVNENVSTTGNNWIKVRVRGGGGSARVNADAIGSVIRVHTGGAGGIIQSREVTSGSSTSSTDEFRQHFGLGSAGVVDRIEVIWPRTGSVADRTDVFEGPFEAGQVVDLAPRCPGDVNGDRVVDSQDFFAFLSGFFEGAPGSDFNADGTVDSRDFFDFLGAFFAGC